MSMQARVDQPKSFQDYVIVEYIGASGCEAELELCGDWVNRLRIQVSARAS